MRAPLPNPKPMTLAKSCPRGEMTYLGFNGVGDVPPQLWIEVQRRFPDAIIVELRSGRFGFLTAERHDGDVRKRHEEAGAMVGWEGNVIDFPQVKADCHMDFVMPVPLPRDLP